MVSVAVTYSGLLHPAHTHTKGERNNALPVALPNAPFLEHRFHLLSDRLMRHRQTVVNSHSLSTSTRLFTIFSGGFVRRARWCVYA
jgi:hypothetical protein